MQDDDTVTGDVRIGIAKLSERYKALAEDMHEVKTLLAAIQGAVSQVLQSRGDDVQLRNELAELKVAVQSVVEWKNQSAGATRTFRWIISSGGAMIGAAIVWMFTTVNQHNTDIAAMRQQLSDHVKEDRRARGDEAHD
jgi:hypothetical protein